MINAVPVQTPAGLLIAVVHDVRTNSLEANWVIELRDPASNALLGYAPLRSHSYSAEQRDEFLAALGDHGIKYVTMAGW